MTTTDERTMARRGFLKRALVVAWTSPVIMTIMSEHALAQTPTCGTVPTQGGALCPNTPACPPSKVHCCQVSVASGTVSCGCYTPTTKTTRCNPA